MLIAVVGDTHGRIDGMKKELRRQSVEHLFFTGDFYADAKKMAFHLDLPYSAVSGNCDMSGNRHNEQMVKIAGHKFYIVHGHQYGVKRDLNALYYRGKELEADAVLFGHTHISCCEKLDNLWLVNPGSPSHPRLEKTGTYALIEVRPESLYPRIVSFPL